MIKNPIINWYSIDDVQPRMNERVLVACHNYTNHMQKHVSIAVYFGMRNGHALWSGHRHATHWAPLPELPRTEKEEEQ